MSLTGSCRCKNVSVAVQGPPRFVANCHCRECRIATGSAFATYVGCTEDQVEVSGEPGVFESSPGVSRLFCTTCGTPIAYRGSRWPGEIHFFVGLFDQAAELVPTAHVYTIDALPWVDDLAALPRFERIPGKADS